MREKKYTIIGSAEFRCLNRRKETDKLLIKHAALRRISKDWLAWNQDNASE
jgi:hypothetical protein